VPPVLGDHLKSGGPTDCCMQQFSRASSLILRGEKR